MIRRICWLPTYLRVFLHYRRLKRIRLHWWRIPGVPMLDMLGWSIWQCIKERSPVHLAIWWWSESPWAWARYTYWDARRWWHNRGDE